MKIFNVTGGYSGSINTVGYKYEVVSASYSVPSSYSKKSTSKTMPGPIISIQLLSYNTTTSGVVYYTGSCYWVIGQGWGNPTADQNPTTSLGPIYYNPTSDYDSWFTLTISSDKKTFTHTFGVNSGGTGKNYYAIIYALA